MTTVEELLLGLGIAMTISGLTSAVSAFLEHVKDEARKAAREERERR